MYFVYILQSLKDGKFYIGQTSCVSERLIRHNRGSVKSTKFRRPLKILAYKKFLKRSDAIFMEKYLKSLKGGVLFKNYLKDWTFDEHISDA